MDYPPDSLPAVHELKVDRDTWKAVALQYKVAFEQQTARLRDLQDICFASQAELENERAQSRRTHLGFDGVSQDRDLASNSSDRSITNSESFGSAVVFPANRADRSLLSPSEGGCNLIFKRVQQLTSERNYGTAMIEIERLLRSPLSPKARAEGLLLKSVILQATGPESLYEALAACSEALELCCRATDLGSLLPKIQYQRGVYYYQLQMLQRAREAFGRVSEGDELFARANAYRLSCDDELELLRVSNRRSAFDEDRHDNLFAELGRGSSCGESRRTSTHLRSRTMHPPPIFKSPSTNCDRPTSGSCTTSSQFLSHTNTLTLLHYSHIRTLLMRRQILYATIRSFAYTSRTHEAITKELRCRDEFQYVAREARRLAEGAKNKELQARAAEWFERAEAEIEGGDWGWAEDDRDTGECSRTYENLTQSFWCEDEEGDSLKEKLDDDSSQYLSSQEGSDREESLVYEEEEVRGSGLLAQEAREETQQGSSELEIERSIFYRMRL
ncbi:hypothetical protein E8E13_000930 [Curvularia kusanoi]|uniref:Uncharacterized protein n=1 Tax=Curvularia kusanoi TaxID=90978 RepID=A0A9P4WCH2_CURKU|nr:hypothetical protein E8E13_000930 [Curvularia kusanoi]